MSHTVALADMSLHYDEHCVIFLCFSLIRHQFTPVWVPSTKDYSAQLFKKSTEPFTKENYIFMTRF